MLFTHTYTWILFIFAEDFTCGRPEEVEFIRFTKMSDAVITLMVKQAYNRMESAR